MNEPEQPLDHDLESLLRGLPLRPPPAGLDDRIAASVRRRPRHPARWAAAAAVLLAAVGVLHRGGNRPSVPAAIVRPVVSPVLVERETSQTFDDGVVSVTGQTPYRRLRERTLREVWWTDPTTGARLWARLPSERVAAVPAETF
jgi:hypothetical protein